MQCKGLQSSYADSKRNPVDFFSLERDLANPLFCLPFKIGVYTESQKFTFKINLPSVYKNLTKL